MSNYTPTEKVIRVLGQHLPPEARVLSQAPAEPPFDPDAIVLRALLRATQPPANFQGRTPEDLATTIAHFVKGPQ